MYGVESLHQPGKKVETIGQKVLEPNSYVCKSYRKKTGRGVFLPTSILGRVKGLHPEHS